MGCFIAPSKGAEQSISDLSMLPSASADVRASDDVITFGRPRANGPAADRNRRNAALCLRSSRNKLGQFDNSVARFLPGIYPRTLMR